MNPPALHANVSYLTNPADDNMLTVTAVVGQNESEAAPADGILFSYFRGSLVEHKCECLLLKTQISLLFQKYRNIWCIRHT